MFADPAAVDRRCGSAALGCSYLPLFFLLVFIFLAKSLAAHSKKIKAQFCFTGYL